MATKKAKKKKLTPLITPLDYRIRRLDKIEKDRSFQHSVDYDYDSIRECNDSCSEGICRCTRITNVKVSDAKPDRICYDFFHGKEKNRIYQYATERILTLHKVEDSDIWTLGTIMGYYGEEVDDVHLDDSVLDGIINDLRKIAPMSNIDMIKFVLEKEYGFLLDELKPLQNVKVVNVDINKVSLTRNSYHTKVTVLDKYKGRDMPHAVCLNGVNGHYRIIDGYHRMFTAKSENKSKVDIVLMY